MGNKYCNSYYVEGQKAAQSLSPEPQCHYMSGTEQYKQYANGFVDQALKQEEVLKRNVKGNKVLP